MSPYGRQDENDQYLKCDDTQGTRDDCKSPTLTPSSSPIFKNDSASPEDVPRSFLDQVKHSQFR